MRTIHEILRDLEYKPGWHIRVVPGSLTSVEISWLTADATDPTKPANVFMNRLIDFEFDDEETFLEWLFHQIMNAERHEAKEWFKFKGKAIYNEHGAG